MCGCRFNSIRIPPIRATTFTAAGRLKPGVTLEQANARLKLSAEDFRRKYPDALTANQGFGVEPIREAMVSNVRSSLLVLVGAVSFVLLDRVRECGESAAGARGRAAARDRDPRGDRRRAAAASSGNC